MVEPQYVYLSKTLADAVEQLRADPDSARPWVEAGRALDSVILYEEDAEIRAAVDARDLAALRTIVAEWTSGARPLTRQDKGVLKRAMKAFRKRLKLQRLDAESTVGGGPMSSGKTSSIVGVSAPDQYPQEVWDQLVGQKRLVLGQHGLYELPPG